MSDILRLNIWGCSIVLFEHNIFSHIKSLNDAIFLQNSGFTMISTPKIIIGDTLFGKNNGKFSFLQFVNKKKIAVHL